MIQTSATMRILVAVQPVDFRKGIDGLAAVCRQQLEQDPISGWAFVFRNRRATAVKILLYDGQGFWLCQKRLSQGHFGWWPGEQECERQDAGGPSVTSSLCRRAILKRRPGGANVACGRAGGLTRPFVA